MTAAVLAIDGGNSKADLALVAPDGTLLGAARTASISHQAVGIQPGMRRLDRASRDLAARAGIGDGPGAPIAQIAVASVAGADYAADVRLLTRSIRALGLAPQTMVVNDTIGALRAGASRSWGVALVCGQGINASAVAPDGRVAGFAAVGDIAGDWGGGNSVGMAGLAAAVRGRDGRGPRTVLERSVPAHFGLARPGSLTRALYQGRISQARVSELAPVVFAAAIGGDAAARKIVTRLADELAGMATALIHRLHLARLDPEVVLAGGVFRNQDNRFYAELEERIRAVSPAARLVRLAWPPVAGAALIGLEHLGGGPAGSATTQFVRMALGAWDRELGAQGAAKVEP